MENALSGAKILVVDDELLHLRSLDRALSNEGCKVTSASSVETALQAIDSEQVGFHAAVVDYQLLDRPGSEVVQALCAAKRFTASLVLTGKPSRRVYEDAYRSGVYEALTKPVSLDVLLPALHKCVQQTIRVRRQCSEAERMHQGACEVAVVPSAATEAPVTLFASSVSASLAFAKREDRTRELSLRAGLSEREQEVLLEVFSGAKNSEIARRLAIAERTVKFHISNINKKLLVRSRGELMALLAGDFEEESVPTNGASGTHGASAAEPPSEPPADGPDTEDN